MKKPRRIFGIEFSGAQDAGKKIWVTSGLFVGDGLVVEDYLRARDLPNSGKRLKACLPAIVELVKSNQNAVFFCHTLEAGKNKIKRGNNLITLLF